MKNYEKNMKKHEKKIIKHVGQILPCITFLLRWKHAIIISASFIDPCNNNNNNKLKINKIIKITWIILIIILIILLIITWIISSKQRSTGCAFQSRI